MSKAFAKGEGGVRRGRREEPQVWVECQLAEGTGMDLQASLKPSQQSGKQSLEIDLFFATEPQKRVVIVTPCC